MWLRVQIPPLAPFDQIVAVIDNAAFRLQIDAISVTDAQLLLSRHRAVLLRLGAPTLRRGHKHGYLPSLARPFRFFIAIPPYRDGTVVFPGTVSSIDWRYKRQGACFHLCIPRRPPRPVIHLPTGWRHKGGYFFAFDLRHSQEREHKTFLFRSLDR